MPIPFLVGLLVAGLAFAQGQDRTSVPASVSSNQADNTIETEIRERFSRSKIAVNEFTVRVRDGVAILEGSTGTPQHKGVATRVAKLGGAREVDNRISIRESGRPQAKKSQRSQPRRVYVQRSEPR